MLHIMSINIVFAVPLLAEENSEHDLVYGNKTLHATIIASKQETLLGNQSIPTMVYNGSLVGPTLEVNPGDTLKLNLVNKLDEPTNLHFHGLHVSPLEDSDNIFRHVAPGENATYTIQIPSDHPPGTFWYHSHIHGLSYEQVSSGLSGLIVIDGLTELLPKPLQDIKQQVIALKDFQISDDFTVPLQSTVNGEIIPGINIKPGETQLWRIANIGSETFYDIILPNHSFRVVAEDGMPVWRIWEAEKLLLPSGKRYDVLVTATETPGSYPLTALSTNLGCVVCPERTLAQVQVKGQSMVPSVIPINLTTPNDLGNLPVDRERTLIFSSNDTERRYMIDGKVFDPNRIDQQVRLGDLEEWTIRNLDGEEQSHSFHIHTNDFQVMSINGTKYEANGLQDTLILPGNGEVVIRISFDDFIGKSVYHCHIMFHGDGGMMGVIEVVK